MTKPTVIEIDGAPFWAIPFGKDSVVLQRTQISSVADMPLRDDEKLRIELCERIDALAAQVRELQENNEQLRFDRMCEANAGFLARTECDQLRKSLATAREEAIAIEAVENKGGSNG